MPTIDIETITSEGNIRLSTGDTTTLEESIDRIGLLQPIVVAPRGDGYVVIDGHRRLQACRHIGETHIEASLYTFMEEDSDRIVTQFVANEQRRNLTAYERAQAALDLKTEGLNQKQIADDLGIGKAAVSELQKVAKAIPDDETAVIHANLFTLEGLVDLVKETDGDPDVTKVALEEVVVNDKPIWSAASKATSYVAQQRFLEEHNELFELLASLNIDVQDRAPGYNEKWFPIASTPGYGSNQYSSRPFADVDLAEHRSEPCHYAWMDSDYSGSVFLLEGCVEPSRHTKKGASEITVEDVTKKARSDDEYKKRQREEQAAKKARKEEAAAWLSEQTMTMGAVHDYLDEAWRAWISNDMAQQFCKVMELEKVENSYGSYSATATMVKHIEDTYKSPSGRVAFVAYLLHAYQYVLPHHPRKELGL